MASQKARLQNRAAGRAILHRAGMVTELRALDGQRSLPPEVRSKIKANPIPKHMSHELHEGRRKARVDIQRRQFKGDPYVTYVDVAAYPEGRLFVVAAVNGRENSLTLAAFVRAETPAAAETITVALVIKQQDRETTMSYRSCNPSRAQPRGADVNYLRQIFYKVDKDRSGRVDANELQQCLSNGTWKPFNPDTVRMMINMFDRSGTGTVSFDEFVSLWKYINDWLRCFQDFDKDRSGSIDRNELRDALVNFGYRLSEETVDLLVQKYDRERKEPSTSTTTSSVASHCRPSQAASRVTTPIWTAT
ncbi:hypothetical protein HPB49_022344 [Dermacentor silvarum]|uniref:Uncharacterized protein n=1 Tax=Dermacentor silvarum TaxID=543639 RepID=A0ACB8D8N4_DERSI|nr:hypothetical protein HPB49_022344 [Dermacentor silvarum]